MEGPFATFLECGSKLFRRSGHAFLRDLTVEEWSDFKLRDLTHFGEEEEQIELQVGRSPLIAHELLLNKLYNFFVSSSPSAVNMTSQRNTLENNSRKL